MAWTAPRTWTVGEVVTKAIMDAHIRDNELYLKAETDLYDAHDAATAAVAHGSVGAHGIADHTNVARTLFISAQGCDTDASSSVVNVNFIYAIKFDDAAQQHCYVNFMCPNDFVSITNIKVVWLTFGAGGAMLLQGQCDYGADGEAWNTHEDDTGETGVGSAGANIINTSVLTGLFANLAKGDYCGLKFTRHGDDAADLVNANVYVLGFLLNYVAEQ